MGFKQTWNKFFNNHSETSEKHWDKALQSRYYKATKNNAFDAVTQYFKRHPNCEVKSTSHDHGEITVNYKGKRRAFVVATVIMVKPMQTSVDLSVTTEGGFFDLGFSHKLITTFYKDFEKEMTVIKQ